MNQYEEKQAARKAKYEARAEQAMSAAQSTHDRARQMAGVIPFGQPILIGHHSESADRGYRAKVSRTYEKAYELQNKAEYYEAKAATVGKGGISSDDPEAIDKLKAKLSSLGRSQDAMKKTNAVIRQRKGDEDAQIEGILAIGCFTNEQAREIVQPDYAGRVGFPSYALQNNNANIQRIKKRIKDLERVAERQDVEQDKGGYTYREDTDENRVMFIFEGKPEKETRDVLKRNGFRWSPTRGAWVRQLNNAAIWHAKEIMQILDGQDTH